MQSYQLCAEDNKDKRSVQAEKTVFVTHLHCPLLRRRLELQEWRAVQCIAPPNREPVAIPVEEICNRKPDRVGPVGRPGGKDTMLPASPRRGRLQHGPAGAVQPVKDDQMGVEFHVLQPFRIRRKDLDHRFPDREPTLPGCVAAPVTRGMDDTGGFQFCGKKNSRCVAMH